MEATQVKDARTMFHGLRAPTLSIRCYIDRIFKYFGCSPSCFVIANIYVDRFLKCMEIQLTSLNVHRLLITSIMLAAKFIDDSFFNNAYYAKVGGISTTELNKLEMKFLFSIDFRLQVNIQTFGRYCYQLEKEGPGTRQIERSIRACSIKEIWSNKDEKSHASSTTARWFFLPQTTVCKITTFSFYIASFMIRSEIISNLSFMFLWLPCLHLSIGETPLLQ